MTTKEKYNKWAEMSVEDFDTAEAMFKIGKYSYVAFMCQQSVEKLTKGIYVFTHEREAPYTHNINLILTELNNICDNVDYGKYKNFISILSAYYIATRYDVYKEKIAKELQKDNCETIIKKTREVLEWLKSQVN